MTDAPNAAPADPATIEVVRNYLTSAATEMQRTLTRTAYNTVIYEIFDFGLSMYDANARLIADAPGLSLFLGANDYSLRKGLDYIGADHLDPGDIVVLNYPYWNSSHILDVCLFAPIHLDTDLVGYTASRAHWLDLGAKDPGYVLDSTDMHQEGLVFPGTKIYEQGDPVEEILEIIRYNSRMPDKVIGDLNAQVAALRTGGKRLCQLHQKYGSDTVNRCIETVIDHGERTARQGIETLPNGSWAAVDYIDNDGVGDELVPIGVEVTVHDDRMTFDFSGSADAVAGPINVPIGRTQAMCKFVLKALTAPQATTNHGHYEPIELVVPEGNLFHAEYPSPTYTLWSSILGVDVIFKALAKGMPERIPASTGGDICSIMLYDTEGEAGRQFVEANNEGIGWGATDDRDGPNALMHYVQTMVRNIPIEVFETKAPVRFEGLTLRQDSGGVGEHRGGLGIRRDYLLTRETNVLSIVKKTRTAGFGLEGGRAGASNVVVLDLNDGWEDRISIFVDNNEGAPDDGLQRVGMMRGSFQTGEVVSNRSGGGGGSGDPFDRSPEAVLSDVLDGYVSERAAEIEYGVALEDGPRIDWDRTAELRSGERN